MKKVPRPSNALPGIIGNGSKYGLVSKVPELDNDIIEDEEHDDAAGDEEKKEGVGEDTSRKQSAASFPDGSRKPSMSGEHNPPLGKGLDAVSDTVGSADVVDIVDVAKRDDGDTSPKDSDEDENKEVDEEDREKAMEENLSNKIKEEGGEAEDAELAIEEVKGDEDPKEEEATSEIAESKPDDEPKSTVKDYDENQELDANGDGADDDDTSEKKDEERLPNAVVLPPMSSMPGGFFLFRSLNTFSLVPDSMLLGSRVSLRSNKSIKSHHSARSHHSAKSHLEVRVLAKGFDN